MGGLCCTVSKAQVGVYEDGCEEDAEPVDYEPDEATSEPYSTSTSEKPKAKKSKFSFWRKSKAPTEAEVVAETSPRMQSLPSDETTTANSPMPVAFTPSAYPPMFSMPPSAFSFVGATDGTQLATHLSAEQMQWQLAVGRGLQPMAVGIFPVTMAPVSSTTTVITLGANGSVQQCAGIRQLTEDRKKDIQMAIMAAIDSSSIKSMPDTHSHSHVFNSNPSFAVSTTSSVSSPSAAMGYDLGAFYAAMAAKSEAATAPIMVQESLPRYCVADGTVATTSSYYR